MSSVKKYSGIFYFLLGLIVTTAFLVLTSKLKLTDFVEVSLISDSTGSTEDNASDTEYFNDENYSDFSFKSVGSIAWTEHINISLLKDRSGSRGGGKAQFRKLFKSTKCPVLTFKKYNVSGNTNPPGSRDLTIREPWIWKNGSDITSGMFKLPIPKDFNPNFTNPCWYEENSAPKRLRCLPYFFLAGFPKSGTTDLFYKLGLHPQVQLASTKEPHWWTRSRFCPTNVKKCYRSFRYYLSLFGRATACMNAISTIKPNTPLNIITGEASASTFWDNHMWRDLPGNEGEPEPRILIAHHIRYYLPNARIIIIVRNPVDRLYSDYLYFWKSKEPPSSEDLHNKASWIVKNMTDCFRSSGVRMCCYSDIVKFQLRLHVGLYSVYLKDWLKVFPKNQIHVIRTEDYSRDPVRELNEIYKFLGVGQLPKAIAEEFASLPKANTRKQKTIEVKMFNKTRHLLNNFYEPFNKELAEFLHDDKFLWKDDTSIQNTRE